MQLGDGCRERVRGSVGGDGRTVFFFFGFVVWWLCCGWAGSPFRVVGCVRLDEMVLLPLGGGRVGVRPTASCHSDFNSLLQFSESGDRNWPHDFLDRSVKASGGRPDPSRLSFDDIW